MTVYDRPEVFSLTEVKNCDSPADSCCAQISIILAFTKAIDLKVHLSLTCDVILVHAF